MFSVKQPTLRGYSLCEDSQIPTTKSSDMVYVEDEEIHEMTATSLRRPLILDGTVNLDYVEDDVASGFYTLISWLRRLFIGK